MSARTSRRPPGLRSVLVASTLAVLSLVLPAPALVAAGEDGLFVRGDANLDGRLSLADVIYILRYLHQGGELPCEDAADTDDSGRINATDFLFVLGTVFLRNSFNHGIPPSPFPRAGRDPTDDALSCGSPRDPAGGFARGGARVLALEAEPALCRDAPGGGADSELIHFRTRHVYVYPGQRHVRTQIKLQALAGLEGITVSLRCDPPLLGLESIDFQGSALDAHRTSSSWTHTYDGASDDGFLASTFALDLGDGDATLPAMPLVPIAHLSFSVPDTVPPGTEVEIRFEDTPGADDYVPIANELVRRGLPQPHGVCGLQVSVVPEAELFVRGDVNRDRRVDLTDAVNILLFLFTQDGEPLACADAADVDDSGFVHLTDPVYLLRFLFVGGTPPLPPHPYAGKDPPDLPDSLECGP
ncbi:MAG: dockerin type I repeat-containing protein [Planctomycetota bacterium]|nr:dockerin type I repeat-containing protein [Planctomycetota bacterium]